MAKQYTSVRITEDAKDDAAEAKREDETWDDYIRRCAENPPEIQSPEVRKFVDVEEIDYGQPVGASGGAAAMPTDAGEECEHTWSGMSANIHGRGTNSACVSAVVEQCVHCSKYRMNTEPEFVDGGDQ